MKHNAKMCSACLKLCNENIPVIIAEKREAVSKHKNSMTMNSKNVPKVKIEPIIRLWHKMTAQLMTSNANSIDSCKTHVKQCLNELNAIDILMKTTKMASTRNL